jgi:hypothetical protein
MMTKEKITEMRQLQYDFDAMRRGAREWDQRVYDELIRGLLTNAAYLLEAAMKQEDQKCDSAELKL